MRATDSDGFTQNRTSGLLIVGAAFYLAGTIGLLRFPDVYTRLQSASGVLASLRGSTYRSVRLASSLAAALLDGLFEHPAGGLSFCLTHADHRSSLVPQ